jgi:hypothetical protein
MVPAFAAQLDITASEVPKRDLRDYGSIVLIRQGLQLISSPTIRADKPAK